MNAFQLFLTLDEINLILTALGKQPYETVSALVASIQSQGNAQIEAQNQQAAKDAQAPAVVEPEAPKPVRKPRKPKAE